MIYGIGVDLVKVIRVEKVMQRWGDRFIRRVFAPDEAEICKRRPSPAYAFALRFAAKEAFSKALGTGMKKGLKWREIEVFNFPGGRPGLRLHGTSLEICNQKGITAIHLSLSDEGEYGVAMVVLENDGG
ncbi:MAG: holo-ACP synthase [Thermodesulfobacteriota bacterium]|nr:holo-ACP synthase [Thermodesulfobacteriota bacterium]